jgi:glycosyltransferase involved in cell wall biosynthesis
VKVLQVLSGGRWAGTSVVVHAIARRLIERGDDVAVVCLDDEVAERFQAIGARAVRSPYWLHPINPLDIVPFVQMTALCRREKYDLVVTHTSKGGVIGRMTARLAGVPAIIHHAHGYSFTEDRQTRARAFYLLMERVAARCGHLAISVSEEHRLSAIRNKVESPDTICTIHNGIDLTPFERADGRAAREKFGFGGDEIILGTVGRLAFSNGYEHMIRAMPAILARHPRARLVIAGDGPLGDEHRAVVQSLQLTDKVRFLGFRRDVPDLLASYDVYVHPSLWEGLSVSILEAMASGKAIVATDVVGNREQIKHERTGLMAPPRSSQALSEAVCRLLDDPSLARQLGLQAHAMAREQFSQEMMVDRNVAVYDRLVRSQRSGEPWSAVALLNDLAADKPRLVSQG